MKIFAFIILSKVLGRLRVLRVKTCKLRVTCKVRNPHRKMYGFTRNNAQETRERVYGLLRVIYPVPKKIKLKLIIKDRGFTQFVNP